MKRTLLYLFLLFSTSCFCSNSLSSEEDVLSTITRQHHFIKTTKNTALSHTENIFNMKPVEDTIKLIRTNIYSSLEEDEKEFKSQLKAGFLTDDDVKEHIEYIGSLLRQSKELSKLESSLRFDTFERIDDDFDFDTIKPTRGSCYDLCCKLNRLITNYKSSYAKSKVINSLF